MGNGATSCTRGHRSVSAQAPSLSSSTRTSTPYPLPNGKPKPNSAPSTPVGQIDPATFKTKSNLDRYSAIWDNTIKLTNPFQRILKAEFNKEQHHQKETIESEWKKKSSATKDSAHVESTFTTQSHSCINLSTSEKVDELIRKLNEIHTQLDETIRRRAERISAETESVLAQIINETQEEQQRLLQYAKARQKKQEETYHERLQAFIAQLDAERVNEIAGLQSELEESREQILHDSQMKIMSANEQANIAKSRIVHDEQQSASMKIDKINAQLENLRKDRTFQHFGTESSSRTSVAASSHVGEKAVGQQCHFELLQDVPNETPASDTSNRPMYTTTTVTTLQTR